MNATVRDSPYFLGFMLTMLGLFRILHTLASLDIVAAKLNVGATVADAGAAVLPTVVGLFMRQVLWSHHVGDVQRELMMQTLTQSLKEQAAEFQQLQIQLVALIRSFVATRTELFQQEEQASRRHLEHLQSTDAALVMLHRGVPERLAQFAAALETMVASLAAATVTASGRVQETEHEFSTAYREQSVRFLADLRATIEPFTEARRGIVAEMESLRAALADQGEQVNSQFAPIIARLKDVPAEVARQAGALRSTVQELGEAMAAAKTDLGNMGRRCRVVRVSGTRQLPYTKSGTGRKCFAGTWG